MRTIAPHDLKGGDQLVLGVLADRTLRVVEVFDTTPSRNGTVVRFLKSNGSTSSVLLMPTDRPTILN